MDTDFFKRFLLAIVLWVVVLTAWQRWVMPKKVPVPPPAASETTAPAKPEAAAISAPAEIIQTTVPEEVTTVETERFLIKLSNLGGSIKEIKLKDYHPEGQLQEPLPLISLENPEEYALAMANLLAEADPAQVPFRLEHPDYATYIYKYTTPDGVGLSKKYIFSRDDQTLAAELTFQNGTEESREFQYRVLAGARLEASDALDKRFSSVIGLAGNKTLAGKEVAAANDLSWVALRARYFCLILAPETPASGGYLRGLGRGEGYSAGCESATLVLPPGASITHRYLLYAGPQDKEVLAVYGKGFEKIIFFGKLDGICKVVLKVLDFLYRAVGNYGLAIILLTLLMNLVLFPLTRHSQTAMMKNQEKMKTVQAKVAQLREKHASNSQKLNQETMALYRKHGVNPLAGGGCLTMILQMPIFIALYITLAKAFELRGATFLWIQDLSQPDAAFRLQGFTIPLLKTNAINVLPILAALVMIVQQRMTSASQSASLEKEQRQQQKMMSIFFTIFLGFIFYNFPAGLNLYFLTNMACMVAIQGVIRSQLKVGGETV